jgi:2-hydroxychromene-2-carboxylate isomerase
MDRTQKGVPGDRAIETVNAAPRVEFFFAPGSRYSYLAASQMALLEAETGGSRSIVPDRQFAARDINPMMELRRNAVRKYNR